MNCRLQIPMERIYFVYLYPHIGRYMKNESLKWLHGKAGMVLCTAGSRRVLINDQLYEVKKGMLCFLSPIINLFELSRDEDYAEVSIFDGVDAFYKTFRLVFGAILSYAIPSHPCLMLDEEHFRFFTERASLVAEKKQLLAQTQIGEDHILIKQIVVLLEQETLLEMVYLYGRSHAVEPVRSEKDEFIAFRFLTNVNQHYKEHRNVSFYADKENLSISHFIRLVKEKTGKTPSHWITTITVVNAKLLLRESDMSVKEIAAELNFPEQFTFRKFFKTNVGIPPKAYRLQNRGGAAREGMPSDSLRCQDDAG